MSSNNWNQDSEYYNNIKAKVSEILKHYSFLNNLTFDPTIPLVKEIYWKYPNKKINRITLGSNLKSLVKTLTKFSKCDYKIPKSSFKLESNSILIYIDEKSLFYLYEPLLNKLKKKYKLYSFNYSTNNQLSDFLEQSGITHLNLFKKTNRIKVNLKEILIAISQLITYKNLEFFDKLLDSKHRLLENLESISFLLQASKARYAMLNVSEDTSIGFLFSEILKKNHGFTINLQNGWRSKMSINGETNFSAWFVHNELMKNILIESGVPKNQLIVTGHLFTEIFNNYKCPKGIGKVILIFSSFLYKTEQKDLADFIEVNKLIFDGYEILIRMHPREDLKENVFINKGYSQFESKNKNELFTKSLIEAFQVSEFSISFGSFVSFQASTVNRPNLNIEYRKESILNFIKPMNLPHANSKKQIKEKIKTLKIETKKTLATNHFNNASEVMYHEFEKLLN